MNSGRCDGLRYFSLLFRLVKQNELFTVVIRALSFVIIATIIDGLCLVVSDIYMF